ncbi:MAG: hypothetical protein JXR34_08935 [Bacteroidales bacterium]|nr:hypothetical protein [Bacteroidales bacterium]
MNANIEILFVESFKTADIVTRSEIKKFYDQKIGHVDDAILEARVSKLIFKLKNRGQLFPIKRGVYRLNAKRNFSLTADNLIQKIQNTFEKQYSEVLYSIWSSQNLHQFMNLQPFGHFYIFETEKDILESTFYLLKENNINVFIKPNKDIIEKYIAESKNPVIIKQIISRSPLDKSQIMATPTIEKILVDIFCDRDIFYFYQGNELKNIFINTFRNYHIDYSKLLNYADRRKQKAKILHYLKENIIDSKSPLLL